jgi:hypothetical protein
MATEHIRGVMPAFALAWLVVFTGGVSGQEHMTHRKQAHTETGAAAARADRGAARSSDPEPKPEPAPGAHPALVLMAVNGGDTEVLVPQRDDGGFSAADLRRAAVAFSQQSPGKVHSLAPRLLDLVYRSMRHFEARVVRVVSGFRRDRAGSRHTQGRAVDMRIEGVTNDRLAEYVRKFGFVGVGFYPKSGFVHLDVRDASYFWIDDSAPGHPNHLVPVLAAEARKADNEARDRGETPDLYVPNNRAEDAAAAKVYARQARERQAAATAKNQARAHD